MPTQVSDGQESDVGPDFNHLKLRKLYHKQSHQCHVMLSLVPTASHDQKSHVTLFQLFSPNEQNSAIDDAGSIM